MGKKTDYIDQHYPVMSYNYLVTIYDRNYIIQNRSADGKKNAKTLSFSEVTGLTREYETVIYKHGFSFLMGYFIIPSELKPIQLTLKRGVCDINNDAKYLSDWFESMDKFPAGIRIPTRNVDISLMKNGEPLVTWKLIGAVPVKLSAPDFVAGSGQAAIESLELIAKDLEIDYGS